MLHIEPLGTNVILPAFVIGYEIGVDAAAEDPRLDALSPDGGPLLVLDQQAGGYMMSYPSVVGAVLRLEANGDRARRPMDFAVRGFKAMAEDPDRALLQSEYPTLSQLVYSAGDEYTPTDLRRLEAFLRQFVDVPNFSGGIEAFVRFEPCDPLAFFRDWRVMTYALRTDRKGSPYANVPSNHYVVEQGNLTDLLLRDDQQRVDAPLTDRVHELGRQLGRSEPPTVFFLWENSD